MEVQARLLDQQKELCLDLVHNKPRVEEQSLNAMEVIKTLISHQNVDGNTTRAIVDGVKAYKTLLRQDGGSQMSSANSCLLARGPDPSLSLEQDFTTNGTRGSLHCPFSKPPSPPSGSEAQNGNGDEPKIQVDTCGHGDLDPIKAEREERRSSTGQSAQAQASSSASRCPVSRCPIRFLDKHSPEEIAEYVERHKHEIPRSHAICVKRYQRDPQNMRQLDAKYGGLINMISGLSAKHQAFLPDRQTNGDGDGHTSHTASTERVEKWAENVDPVTPGPVDDDESRKGHFDRPLREVRVGESPSRPWGIPVPLTQQPTPPAPFSGPVSMPVSPGVHPAEASLTTPADTPSKPAGRCPFGHNAPQQDSKPAKSKPESPWATRGKEDKPPSLWDCTKEVRGDKDQSDTAAGRQKAEDSTTKTDANTVPPHVTFNGPVFFGYSAEQTASLMQQLGQLSKP